MRHGTEFLVLPPGLQRVYDPESDTVARILVEHDTDPVVAVPVTVATVERGHCNQDSVPVTGARTVTAGARHACLTTATGVWCWGDHSFCQLGPRYPMRRGITVGAVKATDALFRILTAFNTVTCGINYGAAGGVCWGSMHRNIASCHDRTWPVPPATLELREVVTAIGIHSILAFSATSVSTVVGGRLHTGAAGIAIFPGPIAATVVVDAAGFLIISPSQRCWQQQCIVLKIDQAHIFSRRIVFDAAAINPCGTTAVPHHRRSRVLRRRQSLDWSGAATHVRPRDRRRRRETLGRQGVRQSDLLRSPVARDRRPAVAAARCCHRRRRRPLVSQAPLVR